jgi:hypothetical protein
MENTPIEININPIPVKIYAIHFNTFMGLNLKPLIYAYIEFQPKIHTSPLIN